MKCPRLFLASLIVLSSTPGIADPVVNTLKPFVDDHVLAGAVTLVASRDRVLEVGTIGFADIAERKPMTADTLFWIASMSKPIAATAVMMLVDEGRISLDDPVSKYLPGFLGQKVLAEQTADREVLRLPVHPPTIRNLLSHTSGLVAVTPLEGHVDLLSLAENVTSYPMLPLRFEPGSRYEYSNAGINTAARIVELVSGNSYPEFLQTRIFGPLRMTDTTFWPTPEQLRRLAKSYKLTAEGAGLEETPINQLTYPLSDPRRGACPAGGLFSTAEDMSRFCRMILGGGEFEGHRYVSAASVQTMTSTQTGDLPIAGGDWLGYGFGWSTFRKDHGPTPAGSFQHGGAYNTLMRIAPSRGRIGILMVQHQHIPVEIQEKMWSAFYTAAYAAGDQPSAQP